MNLNILHLNKNGIKGNSVEFVPAINIKTGINLKYKSINSSLQFTYLSQQYTDASNSIESNLSGVIGEIPDYSVLDMSFSYSKKIYKLETGINNLLNQSYFTRRANRISWTWNNTFSIKELLPNS